VKLLRGHTEGIDGVFLHHVQGAPSACGCGNDQCRWTVDYLMKGGPEKVEGSPAALLIAGLKQDLPGVRWIPVWVTECEEDDQGQGSTGYCGTVHCFSGLCWKESTRELEPLLRETEGRLALLVAARTFRRELPRYEEAGGWQERALRLLREVPPRHGGVAVLADRVIVVVEPTASGADAAGEALKKALDGRKVGSMPAGAVVALTPLDESWHPGKN